ncbi:glycosyltransferase family 4 protein [Microbacterium sp. NPDC058021]|uniref:glycosyltransferase family 4 protein n=1 Tax=Microbacterium sp. NPDC058021 TaxID=3346306 RepID=UPI0036D859A1
MKIAVVNNFFPPRPGGSSHLADHLARHYARRGHEVLVLTAAYSDAPEREDRDGVTIVRIPAWTLPKTRLAANFDIAFTISPRAKRRVFEVLDDFAPDAVHQHGQFFDLTWLSGWWARRRGVPTLLSIHTRLESPLSRFNSMVYALADMILVTPLMRLHRPRLVVMDRLMDAYIDKRYRRAISGKVVIPVGIDPERMRGGDPTRLPAQLDSGSRPLIVSLGHVIPQRNRIALVEALPAVLERHPDALVVVVGGVYHDAFLTRAQELGIADSVVALGARPQHEIPDVLAAAALEVHELEGQGFGTASLEALAAGTPVVAAVREDNFLSIPLEDGTHLFLSPTRGGGDERADVAGLARVIAHVLDDPDAARRRVSDNARELIDAHFTIDSVGDAHLVVLEEMARA